MGAKRFLIDEAGRERILEAVREAEARTRGQIVPVIARRSERYRDLPLRTGLAMALLVTAVMELVPWSHPSGRLWLPGLQIAGGLLGAALGLWRPVACRLIGHRRLEEAVRNRAKRAFLEEGVGETREGTGVLVFVSWFERRAVVLGDRAIHAAVGEEWGLATHALTAGLGLGEPVRGFVDAIRWCGERLARQFPRESGSRNELDDALRERE